MRDVIVVSKQSRNLFERLVPCIVRVTAKKLGKVVGDVALGEITMHKRAAEGAGFICTTFDFGVLVSGLASDMAMSRKAVEGGRRHRSEVIIEGNQRRVSMKECRYIYSTCRV